MRYVVCVLNSGSIDWIKSFDNFSDAIIATNIWISRLNINSLISDNDKAYVENGGVYIGGNPQIVVTVEDN